METITEKQMKYILGRREALLAHIRRRIRELYRDMDATGELIRIASIGSPGGNEAGNTSSHERDLSDILRRYEHIVQDQQKEIRVGLLRLVEEEERINRIWVCYRALPYKEYVIITELYVKRELYRNVEEESGLNHRQFEKIRKRGLKRIRTLYESTKTNIEIMAQKETEYEQLCLTLE